MKPKWKPHDDPQCKCNGCDPGETTIEIPGATWVWKYELPGDAMRCDAITAIVGHFTPPGRPVRYQQTVTGWRRKRIVIGHDPGDEDRR